jgi:2-keto-4-pentenoate hydratase/2-oxohepta-3-ene-1,7-dioic acid hydratase in catechol pathway
VKVANYRRRGTTEALRGVVVGDAIHEVADLGAADRIVDLGLEVDELSAVELLPAVLSPGKIICIGLNYKDHAAEAGLDLPTQPLVFMKYPSALIGHGATVIVPSFVEKPDWEAELAVVIGRTCSSVSQAQALDFVAGYTCINDVSARDVQASESQWVRAKSYDTFAPLGPWLITVDEIPDPQALAISCHVNDDVVQNSSTQQMVFSVAEIIEFVSRSVTLNPGDVIATGTPPGVGVGMKPPRFLQDGDVVSVDIESIGRLSNPVSRVGGASQ